MATLYVRDIPDDIYQGAQTIAAARNQSLTAYVRTLLKEAVERETMKSTTRQALTNLRKNRKRLPPDTPDVAELIHELRNTPREQA